MIRTLIVGTCLGLTLSSHASAQQKAATSSAPIVQTAAANPPASVFSYPSGLSKSAECLFGCLGQCPTNCVPMTSETTWDLAYACFIRGMYSDAIVFARHGLTIREDARLYLIKGVSEMHANRCADAEVTAEQYQNAVSGGSTIGLAVARERVNGPMRVRFDQILRHLAATSTPRPASAI